MRLSRKITGEFIGVFLIGALVGGLGMWDWAAVRENKLIGLVMEDAATDTVGLTSLKQGSLSADARLSQFMSRTNDPDKMIARINEKYSNDYHLSPEELERIQPLIKEMAQHVSQIRHQFGVDIIATLAEYHEKIGAQLTPEHREAYQKANQVHEIEIRHILLLDQNPPAPAQK